MIIDKNGIRTIPDWPKKGVRFRDITTLLKNKELFNKMVNSLVERYQGYELDSVVGIESRGFIIGAVLAHRLGLGFIPIRKKGKLPAETISETYNLEYGSDELEIHKDAISAGDRVLLVDDLLATGGTIMAACRLIERLGGSVVECQCIIDLPDLKGHEKLKAQGYEVYSMMKFQGE